MKIGLVCRHFLSTKGGLEKYTLALSTELVRQGHAVHVFANTGEDRPGVTLHHVPLFPFSSPGKNLSFAYMASKRISELQLDIVQSMERIWAQDIFRASDGINPVQMRERYSNPVLRQFRALGPRRQAITYLEKRIFEGGGAAFIMTNSMLVKDQIRQYYRIPQKRIEVIYNSVDHHRYDLSVKERFRHNVRHQYAIEEDDLLILFAGNDYQRKGLHVLLEALAILDRKNIKLMVAGTDPIGPYQRWAVKHGLGDNIFFLGHQKEIECLYGAADLMILPTRYDAFANVCLEAMACGTPVITTATNGAAEIVENGKNGFVLLSWDVEELAARIRDFLAISDRRPMIKNASDKAKLFTMSNYMDRLIDLYNRVSEAKKSDHRQPKDKL